MAAWGDSMTNGAGSTHNNSFIDELGRMTGYAIFNGGRDGGDANAISDRMLADTMRHSLPTIIWAGNNHEFVPEEIANIEVDIAAMVAALGHDRYLVMDIINGDWVNKYKGTPWYNEIVGLNRRLAATYGPRYVPIREFLVSLYDPNNAQDVIDHERDIIPSSVRVDQIHLNDYGYRKVAEFVYGYRGLLGIP